MLLVSVAAVLAMALGPALAIPPSSFGFPDSENHTELSVSYTWDGNTTTVQEAQLFGSNITQLQPRLSLDRARYQSVANYTGAYTIVMVDPDAPSPEDPTRRFILHWLAFNTTTTNNSTTSNITELVAPSNATSTDFVPYTPPTPPTNSSAHRYILYAFRQPANLTAVPATYESLRGGANRTNFNLTAFVRDAGLGTPAAAEYFYVSRRAGVPGTFIALAGGEYPGGNGGAVFANSTSGGGGGGNGSSNGTSGGGGSTGGTTGTSGAARGVGVVVSGVVGAGLLGLALLL